MKARLFLLVVMIMALLCFSACGWIGGSSSHKPGNVTVTVTVGTSAQGLVFSVDGTPYSTPQTFTWTVGAQHTIATTSPQLPVVGTQYTFASWSDGGALSHMVTASTGTTSYTATFDTSYLLSTTANPTNGGIVAPASGTYYAADAVVGLVAVANANYAFTNWTGNVASANSASTTITMNAPQSVTANFTLNTVNVTVGTSPAGLAFSVDGTPYSTSQNFTWTVGEQHTIATTSPQTPAAGTQCTFASWSDGGALSHMVTASTGTTSYTAAFNTAYQLTTAANPASGGTVTPASGTYYAAGTVVNLTATANTNYSFTNWTGNVANSESGSTTVTMSSSQSVTANFTLNAVHDEWTWVNGPNVRNVGGTYGTMGTPAPNNVPGARSYAVSWIDASGNFWLFGGFGFVSAGNFGLLNDLWEYSAGEWTWVNGADVVGQKGTYGTMGTASPTNVPGARRNAVGWTDASGNFWLFGGFGYDSTGNSGYLNDLWRYTAGQWTWVNGANVVNQPGTYGTLGTPAPSNVPGARYALVSWMDASGNFWLFGGFGLDSAGTQGSINDLWRYSEGEWTWINGANVAGQKGTYGTMGTAAPNNVPGARNSAVSWTDAFGNFWLFGGFGLDSAGTQGFLNDLWRYSAGEWTWVDGANVVNQAGTYGTMGTPAPNNVPGARAVPVSWTDASGNLWLFGGDGGSQGSFNDLWKYSLGEWTWVNGANVTNQAGTYGTLGTASPNNVPGGRAYGVSWMDASGNFWLFGGLGYDSTGTQGWLDDLWKYQP